MDKPEIVKALGLDRELAHRILFKNRHPQETPLFHKEIIKKWHSPAKRLITKAFRGAAKSTLAEEGTIIGSLYQDFSNALIVGSSFDRAVERVVAISHEITNNQGIIDTFGDMIGPVWSESKIVLRNGVIIQAVGRGQALRGVKYLDKRPDYILLDDFEDEESAATPASILKTMRWFMKVLMPTRDPITGRIRLVGTPLDSQAVIVKLEADPSWETLTYPIEYLTMEGERRSTWPARFPLEEIDKIMDEYERLGMKTEYSQEYMCKAEDETQKSFTPNMFRVEPQIRTWQPVSIFFDPARTTGSRSAHTGVAVWSWISHRLIVWDAFGEFWKPDEIIENLFKLNEEYSPVEIGVERDGLEEWLMQPLRAEQLRRSVVLPIKAEKAPKGKNDFIKGLQPFFKAREVIFSKPLPVLQTQLLTFPSGRIDVPNALAYALKMRTGLVVYEDFNVQNVRDDILLYQGAVTLCLNEKKGYAVGVALQYSRGIIRIVADWVTEAGAIKDIINEAALEYRDIKLSAPPWHWDKYKNVGMVPACREAGYEIKSGVLPIKGQAVIKEHLSKFTHGESSLQVSVKAKWVLNGFAAGYARDTDISGRVSDKPIENIYETIFETMESYLGGMQKPEFASDINYSYTKNGQRYISARR